MDAAAQRFFLSPYFAVAGASQDTNKFGYKVLDWYTTHSLPATPLNPKTPFITLHSNNQSIPTVPSVSSLPHPSETGLSIITPPAVTKKILQDAKDMGITAVWLQPGTFDDEVMAFAQESFESVVGGDEEGTVGGEGWCVLVDGGRYLRGRKKGGNL
ncbi:MAG: hypothetical protein MMC33_008973 [Icmadophila ericetorum]|nr:hypothetical protein [Icmadophila ericetorum]